MWQCRVPKGSVAQLHPSIHPSIPSPSPDSTPPPITATNQPGLGPKSSSARLPKTRSADGWNGMAWPFEPRLSGCRCQFANGGVHHPLYLGYGGRKMRIIVLCQRELTKNQGLLHNIKHAEKGKKTDRLSPEILRSYPGNRSHRHSRSQAFVQSFPSLPRSQRAGSWASGKWSLVVGECDRRVIVA